MKSCSCS